MIPIRDENWNAMAGFGAASLIPNDVPKFLIPLRNADFLLKGHLLYGLDRARKAIRTADQAVIVGSYLDVIAVASGRSENVVSRWARH